MKICEQHLSVAHISSLLAVEVIIISTKIMATTELVTSGADNDSKDNVSSIDFIFYLTLYIFVQ